MRFCHFLWLMALLGLTGCATPQAPSTRQQAALTIPDAWKATQTAGPHLVDDGWLSRFQDAQLSKLVDEALLNNRDLQVAAARVAEAGARAFCRR